MSEEPLLVAAGAPDADALGGQLTALADRAERAGEETGMLTALAAASPPGGGPGDVRAGIVATTCEDLARSARRLAGELAELGPWGVRGGAGAYVGTGACRIGFLFPGQGAPVHVGAGALGERVAPAAAVYDGTALPDEGGDVPDEHVQLAVVTSQLAALRGLRALGVDADVAVGHSLGELTALHWAGSLTQAGLLRLARARGEAMTRNAGADGAMANICAPPEDVAALIAGLDAVVACFNADRHTVVSGTTAAVAEAAARASAAGLRVIPLRVVGAFHSPLMREAVPVFARRLASESLRPPARRVVSTVTGGPLERTADLQALLARQLEDPVRFVEAFAHVEREADLLVEVGPGRALTTLARDALPPAVAIRAGDPSPRGLLEVGAALWAAGAPVRLVRLRAPSDRRGRFARRAPISAR